MSEYIAPILSPEIKAIVMDLDGTLYDKHRLAFQLVLRNILDIPKLWSERQTRRALRGHFYATPTAFEEAFYTNMSKGHLVSSSYMRWWTNSIYLPAMVKLIRDHHPVYEWVIPFLQECQTKGIPVVLLSDYGCAKDKLDALGIDRHYFTYIFSSQELGGLKPAHQLLDIILKKLCVKAANCLVVGDREDTDGAMAKALGVPFWKV